MQNKCEIFVTEADDTSQFEVIEILVDTGDYVKTGDILIIVEGEKVSLEIVSPTNGSVSSICTSVGKVVDSSTLLAEVDKDDEKDSSVNEEKQLDSPEFKTKNTIDTDVVVIGAGPGGYTAAMRCSDLGATTVLIEKETQLGGTCLNVGCIPSKALLHAAKVIKDAENAEEFGINIDNVNIDLNKLRNWKESIIFKLAKGIKYLTDKRKIITIQGNASFKSTSSLSVETLQGVMQINFDKAIIATGSYPTPHPAFNYQDKRVMSSDNALEIEEIPARMLVVGCGVIGMEMASVFQSLRSKVVLLEYTDSILFGVDDDLRKTYLKEVSNSFEKIYLSTTIKHSVCMSDGVYVDFEFENELHEERFDRVLISIGRIPNTQNLNLQDIKVVTDSRGFITVDENFRTSIRSIYAIGDVIGGPMLAHKALDEGKKVAEICMGQKINAIHSEIPAVVYTDPEIAWVGLSEDNAINNSIPYKVTKINWNVNGRLLCHGQKYGLTKILIDPDSEKIIGAGIVGPCAGELITELTLAIDMGLSPKDLSNTIHPHPTFSETTHIAYEDYLGIATDVL